MDEHKRQGILDLPKVVAGAIASPAAALLTSRFGVGGTMIGLALSAIIVTVISDVLKVYFARAPVVVMQMPREFPKRNPLRRILDAVGSPFSGFSSFSPARRRSVLIRGVIAGVMVFGIGLVVVTGLELSVGKDLSCWVWNNDCPRESSKAGGKASGTGTLPSILGGGPNANSDAAAAPQVESVNPQRPIPPTPDAPGGAVQTPNVAGSSSSQEPPPQPLPQPSQQQQPPSGVPGNQQPRTPLAPASKSSGNQ